jgi:RNA polymerase sigma-70 factor (ECF subfamily)
VVAAGPGAGSIDADWQLLAAVARGESDAFGAIVERHQERLVRLCERVLGDREEARDAAQEVFLKVYRHAADAEPRGQLYTWLYRIALNHCFNRMRRRKIARFFSLDRTGVDDRGAVSPPHDPADERPDAEDELLARERWRRTRREIDALPESQRAVLLLARFEGLSQREIAATLGITEGAVESRLVRAMRRLREAAKAQDRSPVGVSRTGVPGEPAAGKEPR